VTTLDDLCEQLRRLHDWIRGLVVAECEQRVAEDLARVVHEGAGDVTYAVDLVSEQAIVEWLTREVAIVEPIVIIGEGLPNGRITLPHSSSPSNARWRLIIDPIDGTRGLMYQKRPAWILTGVAPNRGDTTSLQDIELAIQTEIPLVKQHLSDQVWAFRGGRVHGLRYNRMTDSARPLAIQPSAAADLSHGFATVCRFFPGGRDILASLDEQLCERLVARKAGEVGVFEDQYASTGGQIYGLACGQDRFIADLRPLVQPLVAARGQSPGHCCHPYDLCTELIATEAGAVITSPAGGPIDGPLDVETDVAWVGYANRQLHSWIEPVMHELLRELGLIGRS
jgi:fructose-1,6-bisphosphatase/inositol monophosphatase family enzyme